MMNCSPRCPRKCRRGLLTSTDNGFLTSTDNGFPTSIDDDFSMTLTYNRHREMSPTSRVFIWRPDETIASGIYIVRIRMGNGDYATKRMLYLK